jgi:phage terminase large subunit-like protein
MASRYVFDKRIADAAVEFFPRFLCFVDGEWAGRPFELAPWQAHHVREIFGWRDRKTGLRRYRFVRGWVPRKNGKSELCAGLGHLLCIGDGEPGAQVYCHALIGDQAEVVYDKAARMVALSRPLSSLYEVTKTGMFCSTLMGCYRALSGEAYGKHGLSPHGNIGDEAHAWKNGRLHTFLIQGMGARRQPMDITISTAGEIKTYGHELYLDSKAVLDDPEKSPETYVFIYEADKDADWTDPDVWAAANPNLNISLKLEFLKLECRRAQRSPRLENDFRRYHINQWVEQAKRWFPMRSWASNTARPDDKEYWKRLPEEMLHRKCYGGLDLGSTNDITCKVWVFPPESEGQRTVLVPTFWVPEESVDERDTPRTPYRKWIADGALMTTPGNVTDYDFIEQQIVEDANKYEIAKLGYDPWNATQVAIHLQDEGCPMIEFRQGFGSMAAPSKDIERMFLSGQLEHGNHPVLEWMFGNATFRKDPAGNIKPDKEKALEKIDGVVAAVMGVGLINAQPVRSGGGIIILSA